MYMAKQQRNDRITVAIGTEYAGLLGLMSELEQRDKTELVRMMIDHRAKLAGLEPLAEPIMPPPLDGADQQRPDMGARGTYSIGEDYLELLQTLEQKERRDKSRLVRMMIDHRAKLAGLEPLGVVVLPPRPEGAQM